MGRSHGGQNLKRRSVQDSTLWATARRTKPDGRSVQGSTFGAPDRRAKPDAADAIGERGGQVKNGKPWEACEPGPWGAGRAWRGLGSLGRIVLDIFGC